MRECVSARVRECASARVRECASARVRECASARVRECVSACVWRAPSVFVVQTLHLITLMQPTADYALNVIEPSPSQFV